MYEKQHKQNETKTHTHTHLSRQRKSGCSVEDVEVHNVRLDVPRVANLRLRALPEPVLWQVENSDSERDREQALDENREPRSTRKSQSPTRAEKHETKQGSQDENENEKRKKEKIQDRCK